MEDQEEQAPLYGDLLDTVLSHVSLLDLVPASYVSKTWQRAVYSSIRSPTRAKPWLVLHIQSPRNPSATSTHAYDPHSHVWIRIPHVPVPHSSIIRSSHSNLLYMHSLSRLSLSRDALKTTWEDISAPRVWRLDPVIAVVGSHVVVAGGTCDFEDEPLAVELYDAASRTWRTCQPMPAIFKNSASATWLSTAVDDKKMYVLEKTNGGFCSFDPETETWGPTSNLCPNPSVFFSTIEFSGHRLMLFGLVGHPTNVETLSIWEVKCDTFECTEIGKMPPAMLEKLMDADSRLSSIGVSSTADFTYIYNPSDPKEIFCCDFSTGVCSWDTVRNSVIDDRNWMNRFTFTCSTVDIDALREIFCSGSGNFPSNFAGN
ncbi:F-box/kelch-repeat protein At1g23390 [Magnolia sinica]|uniref:F-box/kelch-repeat protein At1g23390 n=1 Tax=Magnolia sinica TaxID=86752 RepID=UPI00265999D3|nr:F-box/kelch-repeat protein At1g23390 [Magnolia sinica]